MKEKFLFLQVIESIKSTIRSTDRTDANSNDAAFEGGWFTARDGYRPTHSSIAADPSPDRPPPRRVGSPGPLNEKDSGLTDG
jgi:hypothetical protein